MGSASVLMQAQELECWLTISTERNDAEEIKQIVIRHLRAAQAELDEQSFNCKLRFGKVNR